MQVDTPQGRKALVTGGSKGIGRATTELFLKLGAEAGFQKSPLEYDEI
jgi:NAD(P)-dependent dehydrogenase (short-subunit alcohol dehydrogenase family)